MKYSPGLPRDAESLESCSGKIAKMLMACPKYQPVGSFRVNGDDGGCIARDLETIIYSSYIPSFNLILQRSHHPLTLLRSRFRNSATASLSSKYDSTATKAESSAFPYSLLSGIENITKIYRRNNTGPKTLHRGTPDITLTRLNRQPSITTYIDRLERNWVRSDCTEPPTPTDQSLKRIP